jgi:hypothetical protein
MSVRDRPQEPRLQAICHRLQTRQDGSHRGSKCGRNADEQRYLTGRVWAQAWIAIVGRITGRMSRPIRVAGMSTTRQFWWSGGGTIPRSSLTPSPSWMESVPPGHIEGPSGLCPLQFPPEIRSSLREWRRSRRWWAAVASGLDAARWRSSHLPGHEIGVCRHPIGPKSIALGRSLEAADSFVDYGDDGRGTVALQKL